MGDGVEAPPSSWSLLREGAEFQLPLHSPGQAHLSNGTNWNSLTGSLYPEATGNPEASFEIGATSAGSG